MKTMQVELYGGYIYTMRVNNADAAAGIEPADAKRAGWYLEFVYYRETPAGGLLYLYQPMCASARGFREQMRWLRDHPRPHYRDVYDRVDIVDESSGKVYQTLAGVDFLTILDAMLEVFQEFDRQRAGI